MNKIKKGSLHNFTLALFKLLQLEETEKDKNFFGKGKQIMQQISVLLFLGLSSESFHS